MVGVTAAKYTPKNSEPDILHVCDIVGALTAAAAHSFFRGEPSQRAFAWIKTRSEKETDLKMAAAEAAAAQATAEAAVATTQAAAAGAAGDYLARWSRLRTRGPRLRPLEFFLREPAPSRLASIFNMCASLASHFPSFAEARTRSFCRPGKTYSITEGGTGVS